MEENNKQNENLEQNKNPQTQSNEQQQNTKASANNAQGANANTSSNDKKTANFNVSSQAAPKKKGNGAKAFAIIAIILILVIAAGLAYYFMYYTKPEQVYKRLISSKVDTYSNNLKDEDYKTVKASMKLSLNVEPQDDKKINKDVLDLLNKTNIQLDLQGDIENKKAVAKLDSKYDNKSLLNAEFYSDVENEKSYVYLKDLLKKYIEVDMDSSQINDGEYYEGLNKVLKKQKTSKKAVEIAKKEVINIIKPEYCSSSKEDITVQDKTINATKNTIKMSSEQFENELKTVINNLKGNEEFLNEFENKDDVKDFLENILDNMASRDDDEKVGIECNLYTQGLMNDFVKVTAIASYDKADKQSPVENSFTKVEKDKYNFESKEDDKTKLNGTITVNKKDSNEGTTKLELNVEDFGKVTVNAEYNIKYNEDIDNVNTKNAVKAEKLTSSDQKTLATNLQKSKIYEIVSKFMTSNTSKSALTTDKEEEEKKADSDEDKEENNDKSDTTKNNQILTYDDKTKVTFKIPEGYKSEAISDNMKTLKKDKIDIKIASTGSNKDEYYKKIEETAKRYEEKEDFKDAKVSKMEKLEVNEKTFYTATFSYTYAPENREYNYSTKYVWTEVSDDYVVYFEISNDKDEMTEDDLKEMLDIKVEDVK